MLRAEFPAPPNGGAGKFWPPDDNRLLPVAGYGQGVGDDGEEPARPWAWRYFIDCGSRLLAQLLAQAGQTRPAVPPPDAGKAFPLPADRMPVLVTLKFFWGFPFPFMGCKKGRVGLQPP